MLKPNKRMRAIIEQIKKQFDSLLLVNTNRWAIRMLAVMNRSDNRFMVCWGCNRMKKKMHKLRNIRK